MKNIFGLEVRKAAVNPLAGRFLVEHEDLLPNESKIADIIGTALEELRASAFGQSLMNALNAGNAAQAVANLDWGVFGQTLSTLRLPLEQQLVASGKGEAKALGDVVGNMAFNVTDPRAVEWAATRAGELVVTTSQAVRDDVRQVITSAFVNQTPPREIAGMIDRQVGLFPRWANAVENRYQTSLTSFIGSGMSVAEAQDRAKALADAYRERLIDKRCQMIARTETIRAANEGRAQAWAQAVDAGLIDPATTTKEWVAEADACDDCAELDTEQVLLDDSFSSGDEMPPAHPNCRCSAVLVPDGEPTEKEPAEAETPEVETLPAMTSEDITPEPEESVSRPEPTNDWIEAVDRFGVDNLRAVSEEDLGRASLPQALGYDALPAVVDRVEFDKMVAEGKIEEFYRGTAGIGAEQHAEQYRSGEMYHGTGIFGNGTYTSNVQDVAAEYARFNDSNVFSIGAPTDMRVIEYSELKTIISEFLEAESGNPQGVLGGGETLIQTLQDPGNMAQLLGYDAIRIPSNISAAESDYMMFLNRGASVVPR